MKNDPDVTVAERIVATIRAKNLLTEKRLIDLDEKLSAGSISAEDWRLLAELNEEKEELDDCSD